MEAAAALSASASASAGRSHPSTSAAQAPSITAVRSEEENVVSRYVLSVIDSLKKRITANRFTYIKNRIEQNKINLSTFTQNAYNLSKTRQNNTSNGTDVVSNFLTKRQDDALSTLHSPEICPADKDGDNCQEENSFSTSNAVLGGNLGARNAIRPIKLPEVPKLPPYTTWIFLDRNQRMTEDQSVLGRRRIYYDASCGEALICSDSEDEAIEDEEEKNGFKHSEDCIIRMTIQECGLSDAVLEALAQHFVRAADDIKARYEILHGEKTEDSSKKMIEYNAKVEHLYCDKDLDAALDSFDNLFCRRCLVFDCKLHGCSQDLVFPTEKQPAWSGMDDGIPCGIHCYKMVSKLNSVAATDSHMLVDAEEPTHSSDNATNQPGLKRKKHGSSGRKTKSQQSESSSTARVASESSDSEIHPISSKSPQHSPSPSKVKIGSKGGIRKVTNRRIAERILMSVKKGQREMPQSDSSSLSGSLWARDMKLRSDTRNGNKDSFVSSQSNSPSTRSSRKKSTHQIGNNSVFAEAQNDSMEETNNQHSATAGYDSSRKEEFVDENICKQDDNCRSWKVIEQGLLVKGLEIFGRNSCLIARNLLGGMKTCRDVSQYMNYIENSSASGALSGVDSLVKGYIKGNELRARSRFFRRRGKVRRLKYTWKSAGYHFIRKRITERKDQPCRQYNPCGCQSACGKQCPCLTNGTCCEKYCGCPKICKNRFRGCHCAKSQCRSRQCPCFAADRECDPDVCRNCWVGCGDGTLGVPNQRGDNYECRNMKLLLKQQQRVLLGRSDVSGWGAFLKNSVGKHEYLGEYTGELISHKEADKRGKIYDRENSSFLFNLNNEFVLDAYRMGDKLKFANHSPDPNCYAKVIMVAGDHRVGIFAKERINAGEELFYDYRYEPDRAPAWARKPEAGGKDDGQPSNGRAKKLAQNTRA
ncbi:histone-lysine N-methyltransferase EZ1-like isoform X3 [Phragmites australis]|uniref:histone-lysine N-methyltransferase EZ1-like isoform X3 n=1 Tax=Phragmites australis TaxID=29695 RepID=UPI002D78CDF7|nr:histone-lysine N-methyltransferase EZ1-like isoform X3 [Phragmites australis]